MKRVSLVIVLLAYITVTCAFTLRNNESKRCVEAPNGECVSVRNPPKCDHPNCITDGCVGWVGACAGICYCHGSGYEYRCRFSYCDVVG